MGMVSRWIVHSMSAFVNVVTHTPLLLVGSVECGSVASTLRENAKGEGAENTKGTRARRARRVVWF